MGRKRKVRLQDGSMQEINLDVSQESTESSNERHELKSLSDNFSKILEIVTANSSKLDVLTTGFRGLEDRVKSLETTVTDSISIVSALEPKVAAIENENKNMTNQVKVLVDENQLLRSELTSISTRMMNLESKPSENNILIWNIKAKDEIEGATIFKEIVVQGLGLDDVPSFKILDFKPDKRFLKVDLFSKSSKLLLLKNARKLQGKSICGFQNIYISDDAPQCVREARKKLISTRMKLRERGIESWVSKSVPPCLFIRRPDGSVTKCNAGEFVQELINPQDGEMATSSGRIQAGRRGARGSGVAF
jgi:uncharacterized coiled-coil protein SlyX